MRVVVALGGNALLQRGEKPDAAVQIGNVHNAIMSLAPIAREHELVLTHGNGPQVGILAIESAADPALTTPYPLDVLGAMTQGEIGYMVGQALQNALPNRQVATILSQTLVSTADPAFQNPTKFVGAVYTEEEAKQFAAERGWVVKPDGNYWRRVVASPRPQRVVETRLIRLLLNTGTVVVCAGGGGVPVVRDEVHGRLRGVEAVVDKDLTASLLAEALEADALLLLTDVSYVMRNFGKPNQEEIRNITPAGLRAEDFPAGSMGPKVDAVCHFVETTGDMAAIGGLEDAAKMLTGDAGTIVTPSGTYPEVAPRWAGAGEAPGGLPPAGAEAGLPCGM